MNRSAKGRGMATDRPKARSSQVLLRLGRYLLPFKWWIVLATMLSVVGNVLSLLSPKLSGAAIDAIRPDGVDFPVVIDYVIGMIVVALLSAVFSWLLSAIMIRLSRSVVKQMRTDLFNHLTCLPISFFDTHLTGDVISILSYDVDTVGASLSTDITQILTSLITVVGSFSFMLSISPILILVFFVTIPMSILFTRFRSKLVRPLYRQRSRQLGQLNGFAEEAVSGLKTIRAYHQEEEFRRRFKVQNEAASTATQKADGAACFNGPTVNLIGNLSLTLVSIFGSILYMAGQMTLGGVSSFVLYSRKFSGPINEFANLISELQSALAAAERVLNLCDLDTDPADAPDAVAPADCRGQVRFRDVSFGYEPPALTVKHIDFTAEPGKTIAIVGETGCGKTTLINLLMRFYDVTQGAVELDGVDIRRLPRSWLRSQFTMVLQDTWLFDGTIAENIAYGRPDATREEIIAAAKAAHIHDMIISMPNGYDTQIKGGGESISKGQKQLLTIARAMLLDARMLILDEATSNVDTQTERRIQQAMLELMHDRTCFVIAHRLSTIAGADQILVMDKGCIVESGTHAQLLTHPGTYAALYQAQFDQVRDAS